MRRVETRTGGPSPGTGTDAAAGLVLRPFRGVRFDADKVADLARVTSPPYDVVDRDGVLSLESADPHNVVRLILPRREECGDEGRYEHAARLLRAWLSEGVLREDAEPGLYVYEQATKDGRVLQRGLLGAVELRDPVQQVILPHEDVMPGPVQDRLDLMRAAQANVEPILLVYPGGSGPAADVVSASTVRPPLARAVTDDGIVHRLWAVVDPAELAAVAADLAARQALIADGHHRYAAYRRLQAEQSTAGPWDAGLALLVDTDAYPLHVGAIHRSIRGLAFDDAIAQVASTFSVQPLDDGTDPAEAARSLQAGELLLAGADGRGAVLRIARHDLVEALVPADHVPAWRSLDTSVLHHVLIDNLWEASEARVGYHHDVDGALRAASREDGVAVLLAPVTVETVFELAAAGERMPRKSTSFGPKPRTGLLLRTFEGG